MIDEKELASPKEIAKGTAFSLAGTMVFKLFSFLYIIYIARAVSQGDIGLFWLALGIVGLIGAWRDIGLPAALTRYVPFYESKKQAGKILGLLYSSYIVTIATGLLLTALMWLGAEHIGAFYQNPQLADAIRLISSFMLLETVFRVNVSYLQGRADIKSMQLSTNIQNVLRFAITVLFFQVYGVSLFTLIAAFLSSYLIAILVSAIFVHRKVTDLPKSKATLSANELISEIAPFGLMLSALQLLWTISSYADRVILGYLIPPLEASSAVAIYSMAAALAINIMVFPGAVGSIFMPVISRMFGKNDLDSMRKTMGTAQRWVLLLTIPVAIVMVAFSGEMISTFYGSAYSPGSMVMAIMVLGLLCSAFVYAIMLTLAGMRLVKLELKVALIAGISNVVLDFLLIPYFGIEGAAAAFAISLSISAILFSHYGWKVIKFRTPPGIYRLFAAGAITLVAVLLLKPAFAYAATQLPAIQIQGLQQYFAKILYLALLGVVSLLSSIVFAALAIAFKCFEEQDATLAKKFCKKARIPKFAAKLIETALLKGVANK